MIALVRQFPGPSEYIVGVLGEVARGVIALRVLDRFPVGIEGELRIDQDLAAAGKHDDHIGSRGALAREATCIRSRVLASEMNPFHHPGMLEQLLELHLTPLTT